MAAKHRSDANHQSIPGLPNGADWCTECRELCGQRKDRCSGCGGDEPEVPPPPAEQIQPDVHPPATRTAETPDAPTA